MRICWKIVSFINSTVGAHPSDRSSVDSIMVAERLPRSVRPDFGGILVVSNADFYRQAVFMHFGVVCPKEYTRRNRRTFRMLKYGTFSDILFRPIYSMLNIITMRRQFFHYLYFRPNGILNSNYQLNIPRFRRGRNPGTQRADLDCDPVRTVLQRHIICHICDKSHYQDPWKLKHDRRYFGARNFRSVMNIDWNRDVFYLTYDTFDTLIEGIFILSSTVEYKID